MLATVAMQTASLPCGTDTAMRSRKRALGALGVVGLDGLAELVELLVVGGADLELDQVAQRHLLGDQVLQQFLPDRVVR